MVEVARGALHTRVFAFSDRSPMSQLFEAQGFRMRVPFVLQGLQERISLIAPACLHAGSAAQSRIHPAMFRAALSCKIGAAATRAWPKWMAPVIKRLHTSRFPVPRTTRSELAETRTNAKQHNCTTTVDVYKRQLLLNGQGFIVYNTQQYFFLLFCSQSMVGYHHRITINIQYLYYF